MKTEQILMCVVALILGMLLANMLKSVCGCKVVEGQEGECGNPNIEYSQGIGGNCVAAEERIANYCILNSDNPIDHDSVVPPRTVDQYCRSHLHSNQCNRPLMDDNNVPVYFHGRQCKWEASDPTQNEDADTLCSDFKYCSPPGFYTGRSGSQEFSDDTDLLMTEQQFKDNGN